LSRSIDADASWSKVPELTGPLTWLRTRFRERPVIAWGATAALAGAIAVAVVIVAVGGGSGPTGVPIKCSVYASDGSVRLTLRSEVARGKAERGCDGLAAKLSGQGRHWRVGTPPLPKREPRLVCALDAPAGESGAAVVEDNPESPSSVGTSLCGEFLRDGWTQAEAQVGQWQREYDTARG
jgi:hypothetical protein